MLVFDHQSELEDYLFLNNERYELTNRDTFRLHRWLANECIRHRIAQFWRDEDYEFKEFLWLHSLSKEPEWKVDNYDAYHCVTFIINKIGWGEMLISRDDEDEEDVDEQTKFFLVPEDHKIRWKGWRPKNRKFPENQKFA